MNQANSQNNPQIEGNIISYKGGNFRLIRLSNEGVEKSGTPLEYGKSGLLGVDFRDKDDKKIFAYGIPEEYLAFAIINEIECPDVLAGEGLCLEGLKIELEQVPKNMLGNYLVWRYEFFKNMERFWTEIGKNQQYAAEMKICHEYLESEIQRRKIIAEVVGMIGSAL